MFPLEVRHTAWMYNRYHKRYGKKKDAIQQAPADVCVSPSWMSIGSMVYGRVVSRKPVGSSLVQTTETFVHERSAKGDHHWNVQAKSRLSWVPSLRPCLDAAGRAAASPTSAPAQATESTPAPRTTTPTTPTTRPSSTSSQQPDRSSLNQRTSDLRLQVSVVFTHSQVKKRPLMLGWLG